MLLGQRWKRVEQHAQVGWLYLVDVITRIVAGHPQSQLDDLLPWAYAPQQLKAVA